MHRAGPGDFARVALVQLPEPHGTRIAGATAEIIGFYRLERPRQCWPSGTGSKVRVPCPKLEGTVWPMSEPKAFACRQGPPLAAP
jgi:hypothetical protein